MSDAGRQMSKKALFAGIGVAVVLAALISWAFAASTSHPARDNDKAAVSARSDGEKAYENIVKDSLNAYHSRYSKYPSNYQELLDDITKTPDLYGANDQGLSELKDIGSYLTGFAYSKTSDDAYTFTYQEVNTGGTITVTNK